MKRLVTSMVVGTAMGVLLCAAPVLAAGNLASGGEKLELKIDTENLTFSQNEIELETGKYYRMDITVEDALSQSFEIAGSVD